MIERDFEGYWSERDKALWKSIDWKARNYEEFPVEDEAIFEETGYFYSKQGKITKKIKFIKYIRPNQLFDPYYGPIYDAELLAFMKQGHYCYPCFDGRKVGPYKVMDRFDAEDIIGD